MQPFTSLSGRAVSLRRGEVDTDQILIAGPDFGIGSSREHAVWALLDHGFRVVISARFGDIFRNNAAQAGLLAVRLPAATVTALADAVEAEPGTVVTVDLAGREVRTAQHAGGPVLLRAPIEIDDYTRWRLMEGLDDISLTLRNAEEIARYERSRPEWMPAAGKSARQ